MRLDMTHRVQGDGEGFEQKQSDVGKLLEEVDIYCGWGRPHQSYDLKCQ